MVEAVLKNGTVLVGTKLGYSDDDNLIVIESDEDSYCLVNLEEISYIKVSTSETTVH
jgi:hypothetical protein